MASYLPATEVKNGRLPIGHYGVQVRSLPDCLPRHCPRPRRAWKALEKARNAKGGATRRL